MIWPAHLAVLYPYPEGNLKVPQVILALLLLLIISLAFFLWRKKYPFLLVGLALVSGHAGPDDWDCPGRIASASRSLHLPAADWFVSSGRLERDGIVPPMASQPRDPGHRCRAYNNQRSQRAAIFRFPTGGTLKRYGNIALPAPQTTTLLHNNLADSPVPIRAI